MAVAAIAPVVAEKVVQNITPENIERGRLMVREAFYRLLHSAGLTEEEEHQGIWPIFAFFALVANGLNKWRTDFAARLNGTILHNNFGMQFRGGKYLERGFVVDGFMTPRSPIARSMFESGVELHINQSDDPVGQAESQIGAYWNSKAGSPSSTAPPAGAPPPPGPTRPGRGLAP